MGKNRHSKDRIFITATEWATEYGGKKDKTIQNFRPLPFDRCAISLSEYTTPVCLKEGVIFDLESLMEYLLKYKKNPITGESASVKDIIRLNMTKSEDGFWMCPITNKAFTNFSHVVAIKSTGNVYISEAVNELNIKTKNYTDLITGEPFERSDILTLQDPEDEEHMALRDINNFAHLKVLREDNMEAQKSESKIRLNPTAEKVLKEIEAKKEQSELEEAKKKSLEDYIQDIYEDKSYFDDIKEIVAMKPTIEDINPGQANTDGKASSSFTSTVMTSHTSNATRLAYPEEIREAFCKKLRSLGKKGHVQIQTSVGNLNIELHCDITPRATWNFLLLCGRDYYNDTKFHRLVQGFMVQGGDPTATGRGGESAWKKPFKDEFDNRILHDKRGIVSMANSGPGTNGSQFFITLAPASHLDTKHTVFGKLVGGAAVLDRIEAIGNDKKEQPLTEIKLLRVEIFNNPTEEAMIKLKEFILENMHSRLQKSNSSALPKSMTIGPNKIESKLLAVSNSSSSSAMVLGSGMKRTRDNGGNDSDVGNKNDNDDDDDGNNNNDINVKTSSSVGVGKYIPSISSNESHSKKSGKAASSTKEQEDKVAAFLQSQKSNISGW